MMWATSSYRVTASAAAPPTYGASGEGCDTAAVRERSIIDVMPIIGGDASMGLIRRFNVALVSEEETEAQSLVSRSGNS